MAAQHDRRAGATSGCWSDGKHSYVRSSGDDAADAGLLLPLLHGYADPTGERMRATVDAVRRELGHGPLLRRYDRGDGLVGSEGCFVACSFWLVEALAHLGRIDDAAELMEQLVGLANDVGLYSEEIDVQSGEFSDVKPSRRPASTSSA